MYDDFNKYKGSDRIAAAGMSVGGTILAGGATVGAIALIPFELPAAGVVVVGVGIGMGVSEGVKWVKTTVFGY